MPYSILLLILVFYFGLESPVVGHKFTSFFSFKISCFSQSRPAHESHDKVHCEVHTWCCLKVQLRTLIKLGKQEEKWSMLFLYSPISFTSSARKSQELFSMHILCKISVPLHAVVTICTNFQNFKPKAPWDNFAKPASLSKMENFN